MFKVSLKVMQRKDILINAAVITLAFAVLFFIVQQPDDWNDGKRRSPVDCLYTSAAIFTGVGFSDGGAISAKLRSLILLENVLAYSQFMLLT